MNLHSILTEVKGFLDRILWKFIHKKHTQALFISKKKDIKINEKCGVKMSIEMTKEEIIHYGLKIFEEIGASAICSVCINSGNSCCCGCEFLEDQIGCQKRNTACTAWLCGVQQYYFNEIGLLEEWFGFWKQVPGRLFRADRTPEVITIDKLPKTDHINKNTGENVAKEIEIFIAGGGSFDQLERKLSLDLEFGNLYLK